MDHTSKKTPYILFFVCWGAYATSYITKYCYSISMNNMVNDGMFDETFAGIILTALLASYGCGQLINGWLGDKFHPKYMIGIGVTGAACADILMGLSASKWMCIVVWCFEGFFCSMLWAPVTRFMAEYLPDSVKTFAGTWISATIPVGTLISYGIGGLFLDSHGYRIVFFISGSIGLVVALLWFISMNRLKPYMKYIESDTTSKEIVHPERVSIKKLISLLVSTGALISAICVCFNGVLKDGVTSWLPTYLVENFEGVTDSEASVLMMILPVVNLVGAFVAVWLDRHIFKNEFATVAVMFGISVFGILMMYFFGNVNIVLAVAFIAISTSSMLGANTLLLTFIPMAFARVGRAASFTGFLDACSYGASAISGVVIGAIAKNFGWGITVLSWTAVAALGLVAAITAFPIWKKGRRILIFFE